MAVSGYFVDANLLTLLVAGNVDTKLIAKHRRLQKYNVDDYLELCLLLEAVEKVYVIPNTLTEASNLLSQHGEPERSLLFDQLQVLIQNCREITINSITASQNRVFRRLGLTDAALLEAVKPDTPLLTVDIELYREGLVNNAAVNFRRKEV